MTTALVIEIPDVLQAALAEMQSRLDEAEAAGRAVSAREPSIVVINDAVNGLRDAGVRSAVERLARLAHRTNMSVELRGHILEPRLLDLGTAEIYDYALGDEPNVFYRCMRPMVGVPHALLRPGVTRVVHNDPNVLASGGTDSGTFMGFKLDRAWAGVHFDGTDEDVVSPLLVSDLLVEVSAG